MRKQAIGTMKMKQKQNMIVTAHPLPKRCTLVPEVDEEPEMYWKMEEQAEGMMKWEPDTAKSYQDEISLRNWRREEPGWSQKPDQKRRSQERWNWMALAEEKGERSWVGPSATKETWIWVEPAVTKKTWTWPGPVLEVGRSFVYWHFCILICSVSSLFLAYWDFSRLWYSDRPH